MARYSVNRVILVGNLGRDPDVRYLSDGKPVANFSLATSRGKKDINGDWTDEVEWHRIVAWERLAELANEHLHKGSKVYVEGRIQSRKYTDKDGVERTSYDIVAQEIVLLDKKAASDDDDWGNTQPQASRPASRPPHSADSFGTDDFDNVPFD